MPRSGEHAEALLSQYGLRVVAPAELLPPVLTGGEPEASPVTVEFNHSSLSGRPLADGDHDDSARLPERLGLGPDRLSTLLDPGITQQPAEHRVVRVGGRILGMAALRPPPIVGQTWTAHVCVEEGRTESLIAAEHLFDWLLTPRIHNRLYRIDLHSWPGQLTTKQVALDCGFRRVETGEESLGAPFSKPVFGGFVLPDDWQAFAADFEEQTGLQLAARMPSWRELTRSGVEVRPPNGPANRIPLFDFETIISPGLLLPVGRPGAVVPINRATRHNSSRPPSNSRHFCPSGKRLSDLNGPTSSAPAGTTWSPAERSSSSKSAIRGRKQMLWLVRRSRQLSRRKRPWQASVDRESFPPPTLEPAPMIAVE